MWIETLVAVVVGWALAQLGETARAWRRKRRRLRQAITPLLVFYNQIAELRESLWFLRSLKPSDRELEAKVVEPALSQRVDALDSLDEQLARSIDELAGEDPLAAERLATVHRQYRDTLRMKLSHVAAYPELYEVGESYQRSLLDMQRAVVRAALEALSRKASRWTLWPKVKRRLQAADRAAESERATTRDLLEDVKRGEPPPWPSGEAPS